MDRRIEAPNATTRAQLDRILREAGVRREYAPAVEGEVERFVANPGIDDPRLADLTDRPFVTIDETHSRDLDQALFIQRTGGGFVVDYALADAAYAVRPDTALFSESLKRGASFYLPGFSVPMLPRALSEGLVSLNPNVERRALVVRTELDATGMPTGSSLFRARIRSRDKLAYGDVDRWLAQESDTFDEAPYAESLRLLKTVGELRMQDLVERDVVQHHRRSTEVVVNDSGDLEIVPLARRRVDRYNEQISLLCNIEGARFLRRHAHAALQPVFKVHERPPESRVHELEALIGGVVAARGLDADRWAWRSRSTHGEAGETLAAYLARVPVDGPDGDVGRAIHRQAIWINRRSEFTVEAAPHHGIGAEEYARFSAPMREVVGIFTHKEALEVLDDAIEQNVERDKALQAQVVEVSNRAKAVQSRIDKKTELIALDQLLERDLAGDRPVREGFVMGLAKNKIYIDIEAPPLEVKLYVEDLERHCGGRPTLADHGAALRGSDRAIFLGDRVRLRVRGRTKGRWSFELV
ncbi:MAG: RNB domain-containing ribonuclease [Deltaproteobacteria bacterium]|jgi:ribonuclease R